MKNHKMIPASLRVAAVFLAAVLFAAGCAKKEAGQPSFNSPEEAVTAFVGALQSGDTSAVARLLGPGVDDLLSSGDAVADKADRDWFVAADNAKHSIDADGTDKMTLSVGEDAWPSFFSTFVTFTFSTSPIRRGTSSAIPARAPAA